MDCRATFVDSWRIRQRCALDQWRAGWYVFGALRSIPNPANPSRSDRSPGHQRQRQRGDRSAGAGFSRTNRAATGANRSNLGISPGSHSSLALRPAAPRRPGKRVQQDDLISAIHRADGKLVECLSLVESATPQLRHNDEFPPFQEVRSKRSTQHRRPRWQDAGLIITATPQGRTVQCQPLHRSDLPSAGRQAPV